MTKSLVNCHWLCHGDTNTILVFQSLKTFLFLSFDLISSDFISSHLLNWFMLKWNKILRKPNLMICMKISFDKYKLEFDSSVLGWVTLNSMNFYPKFYYFFSSNFFRFPVVIFFSVEISISISTVQLIILHQNYQFIHEDSCFD